MKIDIVRDEKIKGTELASSIHGKYPYKIYLEVMGNSNIGKYIVVISNEQLNKGNKVDEIVVLLSDKVNKYNKYKFESQIAKPNMINQYFVRYRVREKSIIDVENMQLQVFKPVK